MDLDKDGTLDLYSGSINGYYSEDSAPVHFFKGIKGSPLHYQKSTPIKTSSGKKPDYRYLIKVNNPHTKQPYLYKRNPTHTKPNIIDINADGNLDLIYGEAEGHFIQFNGTAPKGIKHLSGTGRLLTDINGKILKVSYNSSPQFIDWDGDNDLDLLSGSGEGGIHYSENIGDPKKPKWKPFTELIPSYRKNKNPSPYAENIRIKSQPHKSTTVNVVDYNNDGKLDLIIGEYRVSETPGKYITALEYDQKITELKNMKPYEEELKKAQAIYVKLRAQKRKPYELQLAEKRAAKIYFKISGDREKKRKQFKESFTTTKQLGHLWLYLQK